VVNGGRLVIGGPYPYYFRALRDASPRWQPSGPTQWGQVGPSLAPIAQIVSAGRGHFSDIGATDVLVGDAHDALVTQSRVGKGTVVFVADASPFQNHLLATA